MATAPLAAQRAQQAAGENLLTKIAAVELAAEDDLVDVLKLPEREFRRQ